MMANDYTTRSFRKQRRVIGYLGFLLPIVLMLPSCFPQYVVLQHSISHYYYTNLREIFTGTLCAVGLFLISYQGHKSPQWWRNDHLLTNIAGCMAFGVALIPTNPEIPTDKIHTLIPIDQPILGWIHFGFAAGLFSIFALLSLFVFTLGQNRDAGIPKSMLDENNIYRTCGIIIMLCIIGIPISEKLFPNFDYFVFIYEAIALFAFGTSWLTKGRVLGDKGSIGRMLYGEKHE